MQRPQPHEAPEQTSMMKPATAAVVEFEKLKAVVASRLDVAAAAVSFRPMSSDRAGGTGGQSLVALTPSGPLHVKLINRQSMRQITLAEEFELLAALAKLAIVPMPLFADDDLGLLVTRFLESYQPPSPERIREASVLESIARVLRQLHRTDFDVGIVSVPVVDIASSYVESAKSADTLRPEDQRRARDLLAIAAEFDSQSDRAVLCHGDLVLDNLLLARSAETDGRGAVHDVKFVDFEYARLAPSVWDLASLSVFGRFDDRADRRLFEAYYEGAEPFSRTDFATVRRLVTLLAHFWALAAEQFEVNASRFRLI